MRDIPILALSAARGVQREGGTPNILRSSGSSGREFGNTQHFATRLRGRDFGDSHHFAVPSYDSADLAIGFFAIASAPLIAPTVLIAPPMARYARRHIVPENKVGI